MPAQAMEEHTHDEAPDFSQYSHPIDRGRAGVEGGGGTPRIVPLTFHDSFKRPRSLTSEQRRELQIKQAAIRIACGLESRSLREIAKEIGCRHTAIDNAVSRLCEKLGLRKFYVSDQTRQRLRAARAKQEARRFSIA